MGIVRWSNPSTRRRCRRLSTPPAVLVQSHQQLPRQLAEVSGATTPGFSGPLPSLPSCLESSSFRWSVFGSPPLCDVVPDHTRGAHPTASGRLQTVVLFRQSYPALTNGGVDNADVPCGTGALVTQTTLRTLRKLSHHLGSRLPLRGLLPESSRTGARWATVLRRRGLLPESSRTRGARWATVLRHRGPQIADSYAPSAGKCKFFTFASSPFGKSWTSFL